MRSLLLLIALLVGCGGGGGSPAIPESAVRWTEAARIDGACCYYSALVLAPTGPRIYTNTAPDGSMGALNLYENGTGRTVLSIASPLDSFIRTLAVVERKGNYFALLFTGNGYPTTSGYTASWATSPDGEAWTWHGVVSPYGRTFASSGALTMDEAGNFRAWVDQGPDLYEMRSPDGLHWEDAGIVKEAPGALFASAARTPTGTMLAVADTWPSTRLSILWQCHGKEWQVIEESSPIHTGQKGAALVYDEDDGLIHAYVMGAHWTTTEPAC